MQTNERDMDTLQFNNKRLTKRIEVLQEELNSNAAHQHHSWLLGSGSAEIKRELEQCRESLGVTMEDLQRKIVENQELNEELSEMEVAHNRSVKSLQSQVGKLEQQIVKLNVISVIYECVMTM